jgi:uncharacterized protein (DUF885 family)
MPSTRELAATFHDEWLRANPLEATRMGVAGYDQLLPDVSEEGEAAWQARVEEILSLAAAQEGAATGADRVTLSCLAEYCRQELASIASAGAEMTVTAMPYFGPPDLMAVASRALLASPEAAEEYLARLGQAARWVDQHVERLRNGAAKGRLPVAHLVEQAVTWADGLLGPEVPAPLVTPEPPADWDGRRAWEESRHRLLTESIKPALGRWADELRALLPVSRPPERPGLVYVPGGEEAYAQAVRANTTLPLTAAELHQTGLDAVAAAEQRALQLGSELGLGDLAAVHRALRASSEDRAAGAAVEEALRAVRRAEQELPSAFSPPLPGPCAVTPMPHVVASSGAAPHYTPPRADGTRPGTFWFNTELPTAGTGWDLEGVAFHEAVPGHHLQMARLQLLGDLPELQKRYNSVFGEGWALYAEQLAEEMGLYSGTESILGAISASLLRAARLVVDTGTHAYGWSRAQAIGYMEDHVPLPRGFLANEVDRYIAWPGQALSYLTGKLEIIRARDEAKARLGARFSLPGFHAAVLDSGSVPMAVLHQVVGDWADRVAGPGSGASL